ncbi:MAG: phage portal protein [Actinomycetota bacterium]|nr:phage portal protein [Actinomycetota bacterium]
MAREPGSPEWWLHRLETKLRDRATHIALFQRYYDGDHLPPKAPPKAHEAYRKFLAMSRSNWCDLVVEAAAERLGVVGFRLGEDLSADDEANRIWQANGLDAESEQLFTISITTGHAYLLVWPDDERPDTPRITLEDPEQVIVEHDPGNPRRRAAALKLWVDDVAGKRFATVYLPDMVAKFEAPIRSIDGSWERREVRGEAWPLPNPLGAVPVVPFPNRPVRGRDGRSDLAPVIPIQDRINTTILNRLTAGEYTAFRQRWAVGIDIPVDEETGEPVEEFSAAIDRLWTFEPGEEGGQVQVGEFSATDLGPYIKGVESDVQHIASITRTPGHYMLGSMGTFPSGESLRAVETGLVARVRRKQLVYGEAFEEVMRLAFLAADQREKADVEDSETIWRDPETRTEGELIDGLVKLASIGVPQEALWERLGATPQQIKRWRRMAEEDAARAATAGFAFGPADGVTELTPAPDDEGDDLAGVA